MADVFLSYAREDRARAEKLADAIASKGWSVWWDRRIQVGKSFSRVIEKELDEAQCVIVLWSAKSVGSDWVLSEAAEGMRRGVLVPIAIEESVRIPLEFRRLHTANLVAWPRENADFDDCLLAIAALAKSSRTSSKDAPRANSGLTAATLGTTTRPAPFAGESTQPSTSRPTPSASSYTSPLPKAIPVRPNPPVPPPPPSGGSYTPPPPQPIQVSPNRRLWIVLSYFGIFSLIPYFARKNGPDPEVRWHARNGMSLFLMQFAFILAFIAIRLLVSSGAAMIVGLIQCAIYFAFFGITIISIIKGIAGERFVIPIVTRFAENVL